MRILITGANGFVGKELTNSLISRNHHIVAASRDNSVDMTQWSTLSHFKNIDLVIHLAAKTGVSESFSYPRDYYFNNLTCSINALELAKINKAKLIYLSSYFYGPPQYIPVDEKHPLSPHNPYSNSKFLSEEICKGYAKDHDIDIVSLRLFNLYGRGQEGDFLIPDILKQIKTGFVKLNDPRPKRDYIHLLDVVDIIQKIISYDFKGFDIYNIGFGKSYSVREILDLISKYSPIDFEYSFKNIKRKGEVLDSVADISKVKNTFGWEPKIEIEEGIRLLF